MVVVIFMRVEWRCWWREMGFLCGGWCVVKIGVLWRLWWFVVSWVWDLLVMFFRRFGIGMEMLIVIKWL